MYRFTIFLLAFTAMLSSCSKKDAITPLDEPFLHLKKAVDEAVSDPGAALAARGSDNIVNPYDYVGQLHNTRYEELIVNSNTRGSLKQMILSVEDFTGEPGLPDYYAWKSLSHSSMDEKVIYARSMGADELSLATWRSLAESVEALDRPTFPAILALIQSAEAAVLSYRPHDPSIDRARALGVCATMKYSAAINAGVDFDGVNYGIMPWNPVPHLPPHPETRIKFPWIRILVADALGYLTSNDWRNAAKASLNELIDALGAVGWTPEQAFHPFAPEDEPDTPVDPGMLMPEG